MKREWFLFINDNREGPYTPDEVARDDRATMDTLAWREGMASWLPIREIPELYEAMLEISPEKENESLPLQDEIVLEERAKPPINYWWIYLVIIVCVIYAFYSALWLKDYFFSN